MQRENCLNCRNRVETFYSDMPVTLQNDIKLTYILRALGAGVTNTLRNKGWMPPGDSPPGERKAAAEQEEGRSRNVKTKQQIVTE